MLYEIVVCIGVLGGCIMLDVLFIQIETYPALGVVRVLLILSAYSDTGPSSSYMYHNRNAREILP